MLFHSLEYVVFLVVVFTAFWGLLRANLLRTVLLLAASFVFYMSWNATFVLLIVASTTLDFVVGRLLGRTERPAARKALVATSVVANLGLLGTFKYADFAASAVASGLGLLGLQVEPVYLGLVLPVGISFYTFQSLSYTIDVYRREIEPTRSFVKLATFVAFFPQLVAGPIVRAKQFLPQLEQVPRLDVRRASEGVFLILVGMGKKVLIADYLAVNLVDRVFDNPGGFSSTEVWIAVYAYTWQLYADFSGYTDIARGSARLFGFELPENFDRPFAATGPIEFWRRWHITLSSWVRDYLFLSLGGSHRGRIRTYLNLVVTMMAICLWHGAGWTFVLFGLWQSTGVLANRLWRDLRGRRAAAPSRAVRALCIFLSVHFFVLQWPVFRSPTVERMVEVYRQMFAGQLWPMRVAPEVIAIVVGMFVVHYTPKSWVTRIESAFARLPAPAQLLVIAAVVAFIVQVGSGQAAPFVYFQF